MKVLVEITQQKQIWVEAIGEDKAVEQVERDYMSGKITFDKQKDLLEINAMDTKDEGLKRTLKSKFSKSENFIRLVERNWKLKLELAKEWNTLSDAIGENNGTIQGNSELGEAWKEFMKKLKSYSTNSIIKNEKEDYEDQMHELEDLYDGSENDTFDIEEFNYRWNDFYDFCDAVSIWVGIH
jgi:tRNA nucleotidyltransferase/poly(A) polymerase